MASRILFASLDPLLAAVGLELQLQVKLSVLPCIRMELFDVTGNKEGENGSISQYLLCTSFVKGTATCCTTPTDGCKCPERLRRLHSLWPDKACKQTDNYPIKRSSRWVRQAMLLKFEATEIIASWCFISPLVARKLRPA